MVFIAKQPKNSLVAISKIAEEENISRKFLESILLSLKRKGILSSKKGKNGGYYLIKEVNEVKMSDVLRTLEGPIALVPCVSLNYYEKCDDCPDEELCTIHSLMIDVRDSTLSVLNNRTLKDLL